MKMETNWEVHALQGEPAERVIEWAMKTFGEKVALASSFQAEDMVILHMASRIGRIRVFTLDTGRLPQETYELMDKVRELYGVEVEVYFPDTARLEAMVKKYGVNLFYRDPSLRRLCCDIRKVEPLRRALKDLRAWITGLRRDQWETRRTVSKVEVDRIHGNILKVNPLADWTWEMVWDYIRKNDVPVNKLYSMGYTSIGCAPCTRPIRPGEHPRAGRWWWEMGSKECGIHTGGE